MAKLRADVHRSMWREEYCRCSEKLRCSNAHASRQLRQLEEILSVQLIQRTTRQFNLTYDGLRFYQQVKGLMDGAEQINEQVMESDRVAGHLRIAASASFGACVIEPSIDRVSPVISGSDVRSDLLRNAFGSYWVWLWCGVFFTNNPPEGYIGHHLRSLHCKPFAHKAYLSNKPSITAPEDLYLLDHIVYRNEELNLDTWHFHHMETKQKVSVVLQSVLSFNLVQSMLEATLAGCGVAMLDEFALEKLSGEERSQLIPLLPEWQTDAILPLYILYPKREHLPKRTQAFIEHFKQQSF